MITVGCKVIRKPEHRTHTWRHWCEHLNRDSDYKFTVRHYDKEFGVITLEEGSGTPWSSAWDANQFLVCKEAEEPTAPEHDMVKKPKHYAFFDEVESIQVIASSMTKEEFRGFCFGNRLKYRMRAGKKDNIEQELNKSDFYIELFNQHKNLCRTSSLFGA